MTQPTLFLWLSVILSLLGSSLQAQNCLPDSPITTNLSGLSTPTLRSLLEKHRSRYQTEEIEVWKSNVAQCQLGIDRELSKLESNASTLSFRYQDVLAYKDVAGLEKQIKDLEESEQKSREELALNLSKIKHTGIFVVLLKDIDIYAPMDKQMSEATKALSSRAIEDLNGIYIRRFSQVTDYNKVQDVIESLTSGEVNVERELYENVNRAQDHFLYVCRVAVTPLKASLATTVPASMGKALVLNLKIDTDYRTQLRAAGVRDTDLDRIEQDIATILPSLDGENRAATERQESILRNGNDKVLRIQRDIEDAKRKLAERSEKIRKLCEAFSVRYEPTNVDNSVQNLLRTIRSQIDDLYKQWNQIKEGEVVYRSIRHAIGGDPRQSIAEEIVKQVKLIQSQYRSIQKVEERLDIENLQVNNYESKREVEVFREVDQIWAYPVPEPDGTFSIFVFANFRITEQRPVGNGSTTPEPARNSNMVLIKGGSYDMGDTFGEGESNEKPVHRVTVSDFYLGRNEVSTEEFSRFVEATNYTTTAEKEGDSYIINSSGNWETKRGVNWRYDETGTQRSKGSYQHPVIHVSWYDAVAYCNWLSKEHGYTPVYTISGTTVTANWSANGYRLPTEAEWEYAARSGGKHYKYAWGNGSPKGSLRDETAKKKYGWGSIWSGYTDGYVHSAPVGTFPQGDLGLNDMSGNVWEWCWDWYGSDYYSKSNGATNPKGPDSGSNRVIRGGSWDSNPAYVRVAFRSSSSPGYRFYDIGFRLARMGR